MTKMVEDDLRGQYEDMFQNSKKATDVVCYLDEQDKMDLDQLIHLQVNKVPVLKLVHQPSVLNDVMLIDLKLNV